MRLIKPPSGRLVCPSVHLLLICEKAINTFFSYLKGCLSNSSSTFLVTFFGRSAGWSLNGRGKTWSVDCLFRFLLGKEVVCQSVCLMFFRYFCGSAHLWGPLLSDSFADEFVGPSAVGPFVSPSVSPYVSPSIGPCVYLISYLVKFYHKRISSVSLRCRNFLKFVNCKEIWGRKKNKKDFMFFRFCGLGNARGWVLPSDRVSRNGKHIKLRFCIVFYRAYDVYYIICIVCVLYMYM